VIVNSFPKAIELLENKGSIYCSRPYLALTGDLMGNDRILGFIPYNARMKKIRKMLSREIGSRNKVQEFHEQLENQGKSFIETVRKNPSELWNHVYLYVLLESILQHLLTTFPKGMLEPLSYV
jgi:hypothetical protein